MRVTRSLFLYTLAAALVTCTCALLAGETIASIAVGAIGLSALLALRGRTWSSLVLGASCAGAIAMGAAGAAPWWTLAPAVAGGVACAVVAHLLLRSDRAAGAALLALSLTGGAALAFGGHTIAEAVSDPPYEHPALTLGDPWPWYLGPDYQDAYRRGKAEARADILASRPRILTYGLPDPARPEYAELLEQRLGVQLDPIAACLVTDEITGRAEGYDVVMIGHLEARHGRGILDRLWAEAERRHAHDRPAGRDAE
jgi:hypothetical protein